MSKSYWLISALALILGFSSCSKNDDPSVTAKFKVYGVQDLQIQPYPGTVTSAYMQLRIDTLNRTGDERLTMSIIGAPAGCGVTMYPASGYVPFDASVYITDTAATAGTYPMQLVCTGNSGKKTYNFNLTILPEPDFTTPFIGTFTGASCGSVNNYSTTITKGAQTNRIVFNNFDNSGGQVYADITSNGYYINIPAQTVNGITYYVNSANVYTSSNTIQFYFYKIGSSGTSNFCNMYLSR